ncbi:MAG: ABC transporter ATP-binding protein/permease [Oscillospiraceae bacterium]|jgi:ATP-binding cassette subfamily B protein|nr:ABC transporter ATP-binding protein/permease [Oscillospiraceae bacterium]
MRKLLRYLRPYAAGVAAALALVVAQAGIDLALPTINAQITNHLLGASPQVSFVLMRGLWMLLAVLAGAAAAVAASFFSSRAAMGFGRAIRAAVFRKVEGFSQAEMDRFGAPSLITRTGNDIQQVQMTTMMMMRMMAMAPIMCAGGIIMALRQDAQLSWVILAAMPFLGVIIGVSLTRALPYFKVVQQRIDRLNQVLREALTGIRVIRAFNRDRAEEARFDAASTELMDVSMRVGRLMAAVFPCMMLLINLVTVAILWFGGHRVEAGLMDVGAVQAFISYAAMILFSLMMGTMIFIMVPRAQASAVRINEVLETAQSICDPAVPRTPGEAGGLTMTGVGFAYPGAEAPVLADITFTALPGQTTAIIGSTGSGKSTLINLIPRFFDVTTGSVRLGGVDVRELAQADLRVRIGFVPQKAFLFHGTVADNLRYGKPDATEEEMWHALAVAQAADFVRAMPEGLAAPIAQGGINVSGGQRQRLAIARALVRKPNVYVFDDSFSALDFKTDADLRAALQAETRQAAVIIVAQRVTTILRADNILVLDEGRIVGQGAHKQLMESCEVYRQIVLSQMTEEEIA